MHLSGVAKLEARNKADMLVVPFWKGKHGPEAAIEQMGGLKKALTPVLASNDFKGREEELLVIYEDGEHEKRIALLGLGERDKITVERLRRAYAPVTKFALKKRLKSLNVPLPQCEAVSNEGVVQGALEGLLLPNYSFHALKHDTVKDDPPTLVEKIALIGASKKEMDLAHEIETVCQGIYLTRDLVNGNADDVTPQHLAKVAVGLAKSHKNLKTTVFDKKWIVKEKMGLLLAVNRGSDLDPVFMTLTYRGNPKSDDHTVIVGKGITFDTGGLNLKSSGMETMKDDMSGAAIVLGVMGAVAELGLKVNITGVIASTDNAIDAKSYKPGDVYQSHSGKTVEIGNTDAEGRLILADALSYTTRHLKPTRIIDFATLTGAMGIALGTEAAGLFTNNDALADLLLRAGAETGERLWRMPMFEEYRELLKSDVADIKSTGGRLGSSILAAQFLQDFVGKTPWAHIDIAATAFSAEGRRYFPKFSTGVGVRLIVALLQNL